MKVKIRCASNKSNCSALFLCWYHAAQPFGLDCGLDGSCTSGEVPEAVCDIPSLPSTDVGCQRHACFRRTNATTLAERIIVSSVCPRGMPDRHLEHRCHLTPSSSRLSWRSAGWGFRVQSAFTPAEPGLGT